MTKKSALTGSCAKLAQKLIDQALEEGVTIEDRLEVLKIAGGFCLGSEKIKMKTPDDDNDAPSFANFRNRVNGTPRETSQ
jgi:hypothetical protein